MLQLKIRLTEKRNYKEDAYWAVEYRHTDRGNFKVYFAVIYIK